jgi:hypothetical protein
MKRSVILAILAGFITVMQPFERVAAQGVRAGDGPLFSAQELRLDLFGTWATRDRRRGTDDRAGLGLGANYFFTHNVGIAAETYMERVRWPVHMDVSIVGRIPLEAFRFAPYAFAGGGRQWSNGAQWTAHIGGGGEFRMTRQTGVFMDARRVFADRRPDFALYRLGFRFGF